MIAKVQLKSNHQYLVRYHSRLSHDVTFIPFSEDVRRLQERAPELMETSLKFEEQTLDQTSDIWSLGCTILQFLLDTDTWNILNFMKQFGVIDQSLALQKV